MNDTLNGVPLIHDMYVRNHRVGYGTYILVIWILGKDVVKLLY